MFLLSINYYVSMRAEILCRVNAEIKKMQCSHVVADVFQCLTELRAVMLCTVQCLDVSFRLSVHICCGLCPVTHFLCFQQHGHYPQMFLPHHQNASMLRLKEN